MKVDLKEGSLILTVLAHDSMPEGKEVVLNSSAVTA
jgi:hypothetical protein